MSWLPLETKFYPKSLPMIEDQRGKHFSNSEVSIYAFQGNLSPVSFCSIVQHCVLPILLYGPGGKLDSSRSWNVFKGRKDPVDANLKVVHQQSCLHRTRLELHPFSVHHQEVEIFCTELIEQMRRASVIKHTQPCMVDDVGLLRECRELKESYQSDFTTQILKAAAHLDSACVLREAEKHIFNKDQALLLAEVSQYHYIHNITMGRKLWDQAMDHSLPALRSIKNLLSMRVMTCPDHAKKKCPP